MRKKLIIGCITGILAVSAIALVIWQSNKSKAVPTTMSLPTVKVTRGEVTKAVYASGVIAEKDSEEINAETAAKVKAVFVKKGDTVKAGDLLFTMDEGNSQLSLQQEELNIQSKSRQLQQAMVDARTDVIISPDSGNLSAWLVKEGDKVEKDMIVAEITDITKLQVTTAFSPNGADKIKVGQKARIFLTDSYSYINGTVSEVDRRSSAGKAGGMVLNATVIFNNPGAIQTGTEASIEIFTGDGTPFSSVENGIINRPDPVKVRAGLQGTITHLNIKEGKDVKKGGQLAKVDITEVNQLVKDRQLELKQVQLAKEIKDKEISKFKVFATKSGIITDINVEEGKIPPQNKPAVVISGGKGLQFLAKVEELDVPFISLGQRAVVYTNSFGDQGFEGVITEAAGQGIKDGSTVVFETKVRINHPQKLKVGMTGDVAVVVDKKDKVLRLPITSIVIDNGTGTVMIQGKNGPEPRDVKIGLEGDEFAEIISGLKEGDEVILNPGNQN